MAALFNQTSFYPINTLPTPPTNLDDTIAWSNYRARDNYALASKTINTFDFHDRNCEPSPNTDPSVNWNGVLRLLLLSLVSTGGSMGSIFVISAITVIETFQVRGNVYLVSLAFSHLMVTLFVLPSSCVAIMAGIPNDPAICHFQWIITIACLMVSVLSFMFMATENFLGLGSLVAYDICCTKFRIILFTFITWFWGIGFAFTQHIYDFGPSFCAHEVNDPIWVPYHASVGAVAILLPTLVTMWYFTRSAFRMKHLKVQYETNPGEDPWAYIFTEESVLQSNIIVYIISFLMWAPFCVVGAIHTVKPMSADVLQTVWWLALSNSCGYSYVYAFTNRDFGEAFFKLFYYCCCKSHVTFTRKGAGVRRGLANDPMGLRVHIIPGLNIYNQRREPQPMRTNAHVFGGHLGGGSSGGGFGGGGGYGGGSNFGPCRGPFARFQIKSSGGMKSTSEL
ncbi:histamine H2 receptor-like protein [Dinothrombium tinctorium]|uniref:Histamine H2 receptor-like protein n=1 Tax=Dinothrombium tinctorium TaxID=1965070 RepID=A0A443QH30_9ACAR|nr:histamine H2 receptor-like protein [Dinothrombium tinctorium]